MLSDDEEINKNQRYVGRYLVHSLIGEGSAGRIYLAEDPVLQRKVALKVLKFEQEHYTEKDREEYFERFSLEARASAGLHHPSIVPVYDAGQENNVPWIAFQYIEGRSLESILKSNDPVKVEDALHWAHHIATALHYAHSRSVIHRDIKPANILIDIHDNRAKITDFGIAKVPWVAITQTGFAVGSPGYMSPEQIQGLALDERTDIFSLGVVLYQLLCRRHPFIRNDLRSTLYATINGTYAPLSEVKPDLPPSAGALIARCLTKDKNDRIRSAAQLIAALRLLEISAGTVSLQTPEQDESTDAPFPSVSVITPRTLLSALLSAFSRYCIKPVTSVFRFVSRTPGTMAVTLLRTMAPRHCARIERMVSRLKRPSGAIAGQAIARCTPLVRGITVTAHYARQITRRLPYRLKITLAVLILLFCMMVLVTNHTDTGRFFGKKENAAKRYTEKERIEQCRAFIESDDPEDANKIAVSLVQSYSGFKYGYIFQGIIALMEDDCRKANASFKKAKDAWFWYPSMNAELPFIINQISKKFAKKEAPQACIDIVVITLESAYHPIVNQWASDTRYWVRWNGVKTMETAKRKVDMIEVYILDLKYAPSIGMRVNAVKKLGETADKKGIPALKEARNNLLDPIVAYHAHRTLKKVFNER